MKRKRDKIVWNIKDILSSSRVMQMTLEEEGAYRRALDIFYLTGGLPSDVKELAKVIGKGCSVEVASVVRSMFVEDRTIVNGLTHEYLDKLSAENISLGSVEEVSVSKNMDVFVRVCEGMQNDEYVFRLVSYKYAIDKDIFLQALDYFQSYKMATGDISKYESLDQIRKNFINFIPYFIKQQRENESKSISGLTTNSKSVTSKLAGW